MDPNESETASGCKDVIKTVEIQNLPDEILLKVFELFTHKEIITQLSLVCRHWQELAQDPSLYRKLEFIREHPSTRMAVKLVKMAPWLFSLDMCWRNDADEILRHVGIETSRLKVLSLFQCRVTLQSVQYLKNCTKNQEIYLEGLPEEVQTELWLHVAKGCQDVEVIQGTTLSDNTLSLICNKHSQSLKVLKQYYENDIDASILAVARCTYITTLHLLSATSIKEENMVAIGGMPNLLDLEINQADLMTPKGWLRVFRKSLLEKLWRLVLVYCQGVEDVVKKAIMKNSKVLCVLCLVDWEYATGLTLVELRQLVSHLEFDVVTINETGICIEAYKGVYM